jgi:hypothetical protein
VEKWSLWDGRSLRTLKYPRRPLLDPEGARLVGGELGATQVRRLHEPSLVRSLGGNPCTSQRDHIVTQQGHEICLWRVPCDFLLGTARPEDVDRRLEPHDRELAQLFILERLRYDISLEEGPHSSGEFAIELE